METKIVGLADYKIVSAPDFVTTIGLGSCVGVTLYDKILKIGGLLHVMLPTANGDPKGTPAKFADSGIDELVRQMAIKGCNKANLIAKIAGGANMFASLEKSNIHMIGQRNIIMCRAVLAKHRIMLLADETGGDYGRTITLYSSTGQLHIKTVGHGEKLV